ncbi:MAG: glycine cleavage system protein GcvH [Firmicutes bacterium]|nr:glycine cleavage system protein GcvH [Bacillota bacterium]
MSVPADLKYSKDHEWVRVEGDVAVIGITDFAQSELGDVVFVELPETDIEVAAGDPLGVIESVKAVSDIFSPVSGTVVEVNAQLEDTPEAVNEDCYGAGWIAKVSMSNPQEVEKLLSPAEYEELTNE